jgi:hypothetical protein
MVKKLFSDVQQSQLKPSYKKVETNLRQLDVSASVLDFAQQWEQETVSYQ